MSSGQSPPAATTGLGFPLPIARGWESHPQTLTVCPLSHMGAYSKPQSPAPTLLSTPSSHLQPSAQARAGGHRGSHPSSQASCLSKAPHSGVQSDAFPGFGGRGQQNADLGSSLTQAQGSLTPIGTHMATNRASKLWHRGWRGRPVCSERPAKPAGPGLLSEDTAVVSPGGKTRLSHGRRRENQTK